MAVHLKICRPGRDQVRTYANVAVNWVNWRKKAPPQDKKTGCVGKLVQWLKSLGDKLEDQISRIQEKPDVAAPLQPRALIER